VAWTSLLTGVMSPSGTLRRWRVVGFRRVAAVGRGEGTQLCL